MGFVRLLVPSLRFGKRPLHSLSNLCDYYKILEVDYDATDEKIRLNYRKLALKWHPDKHKGDDAVTTKFQEINEAYNGKKPGKSSLSFWDPDKRFDYDITGIYEIDKYTLREYLTRFKGMILTCNGLGIGNTSI
ncbi:CHAPERONE DNAJ-DOMAIN SUPERFAMILY PROTEIN, partial [Salix purpurea]